MTTALEGGEGSASRPSRSLPLGKTRYSLYRRLGGPQGRSGQVRKISPSPGFDPRNVQPVAIRYTDYATRHTRLVVILITCHVITNALPQFGKESVAITCGVTRVKNELTLTAALFWVITRRVVIIYCRLFGTTYRSRLHGSILHT